jgi:hypothetical protein
MAAYTYFFIRNVTKTRPKTNKLKCQLSKGIDFKKMQVIWDQTSQPRRYNNERENFKAD